MSKDCCATNCCIGVAEMKHGEKQRFFLDLGDWLQSVGGSPVKDVNWVSKMGNSDFPLIFHKENFNSVSKLLSVMIEGGAPGCTYEAHAFVETQDCQRSQHCFQVYIKGC